MNDLRLISCPRHTCAQAKQWLQRWKGPQLSEGVALQRLLEAAGMDEAQAGGTVTDALGVLLGTSTGAPVSVSHQVDALVAVLGGLAARRPLILAIEDVRGPSTSSLARPACVLLVRSS